MGLNFIKRSGGLDVYSDYISLAMHGLDYVRLAENLPQPAYAYIDAPIELIVCSATSSIRELRPRKYASFRCQELLK